MITQFCGKRVKFIKAIHLSLLLMSDTRKLYSTGGHADNCTDQNTARRFGFLGVPAYFKSKGDYTV